MKRIEAGRARARCEAATPGPWLVDIYKGGTRIVVAPDIPINIFRNIPNSQFIVDAREYLPAALEMLERAMHLIFRIKNQPCASPELRSALCIHCVAEALLAEWEAI